MKHAISNLAYALTPPVVWNAYLRARGLRQRFPWREFGFMGTTANAEPLFTGRFAELYAKIQPLDPYHSAESTRYTFYNACVFAWLCRAVPGDFLCGGISWGVAARLIYEFVEFSTLGKTLHLVDPFDARTSNGSTRKTLEYNSDPSYVRRQYPETAPIIVHCKPIPIELPGRLAFVFLNTGDPQADAKALPSFYAMLNPGGCILLNNYANNIEHYRTALALLDAQAIWQPSGQGLVVKESLAGKAGAASAASAFQRSTA